MPCPNQRAPHRLRSAPDRLMHQSPGVTWAVAGNKWLALFLSFLLNPIHKEMKRKENNNMRAAQNEHLSTNRPGKKKKAFFFCSHPCCLTGRIRQCNALKKTMFLSY